MLAALIVRLAGRSRPESWQRRIGARTRRGRGPAGEELGRADKIRTGQQRHSHARLRTMRWASTRPRSIRSVRTARFDRRQHALRGEHDRAIDAYRRALALWHGNAYIDVADWEPGAIEAERLAEIRDKRERGTPRGSTGRGRAPQCDRGRREARARSTAPREPVGDPRDRELPVGSAGGRARDAPRQPREDVGRARHRRRRSTARARDRDAAAGSRDLAGRVAAPREPRTARTSDWRRYGPDDADAFFGRDADIDAIRDRMRQAPLVAVVGASGSGKSSLVLAGVLPRITRARRVAVVTAGRDAAVDLRSRIARQGALMWSA